MIIVKLMGGLGNQLFQYALGRRLALKNKTELFLDISRLESYGKPRQYSLSHLAIAGSIATNKQLAKLKIINLFDFFKPYGKKSIIRERGYPFDPSVINAPRNVYLDGHWQTEKYFKDIEDTIRRDITIKDPPDKKYLTILDKIRRTNSVSLHVRRTDYLVGKNTSVFTICQLEYYKQALMFIAQKIGIQELFVFSDDIEWANKNISFPCPITFVSDSNFADYQELMLMSSCKHNIIANSTFSWWGAWLNNNPQKIVITPKNWFVAAAAIDEKDMIPSTWIKI
ncbi:MAG: alpha-1,2-fucosyltransferase [bacterium]|nr:alpha-1,2-fucosyltransferase [bacterium]